jgi:FixJ family two-component response regulator
MTKVGHIYLIDDESMRTSLCRMLKDVAYIVNDFSSALTFFRAFSSGSFGCHLVGHANARYDGS